MMGLDAKASLHDYLQGAREVLLWKLEGLSEYDIRRPLTPSGTAGVNGRSVSHPAAIVCRSMTSV